VTGIPGIDLEPAFILHARPWQETSQILEVLSRDHGRVGLVARGSRRPKSRLRSVLQLFQPLRLSWVGRGSLHTLRGAEPVAYQSPLTGDALMAAWYLNELLLGLLTRGDPHASVFALYAAALTDLRQGTTPELALRRFELRLLVELGYGLTLSHEAGSDAGLDPATAYEYVLEHGPVPVGAGAPRGPVCRGDELLAMARDELAEPEVLAAARRLLRPILAHHLGGRTLRTREVYAAMRR
jgi:DNA repair protein RecO (recombination protein O)